MRIDPARYAPQYGGYCTLGVALDAHAAENIDPETAWRIIDALSASGLPQWPYAFSGDSRDRLTAAEIDRLAFGRTWQGRVEGGGQALALIKPNGELVFRTMTQLVTGRAFVSGDRLCERIEALSLGRPVCGPVYSRTNPSSEDDLEPHPRG